jgi:hypothetical protein
VVALLSAGYRWDRPTTGVLLTDGVGEIELASAFRPYTELSYLARPVAVTADGRPVRSRHGLTFAPRAVLATAAPRLDRVLVPGADAARHGAADGPSLPEQVTPVYLPDRPGFAFDAALRDIARTRDVATARWVAKSLQYPTATPWLSGPAWPWDLTLRPVLIAAGAVAAAVDGLPRTEVLGPAPLFRLRGRERFQVVVKTGERADAVRATGAAVDAAARDRAHREVSFSVDVDPQ